MQKMILFICLFVVAVATNAQAVINGGESYVSGYRYNGPAHKYLPPPGKDIGYQHNHNHQQQSYNGPSHQYLPIAKKPLTTTTTTQAPLTSSSSSSQSPSYSYGGPYNMQYYHQQTTQLQPAYAHGGHDNGYDYGGDAYNNYGNRYYDNYVSKPSENYYVPPSKAQQLPQPPQEPLNNYNKHNHNQLGYNYGVPQAPSPPPSTSSSSSSSLQSTYKPHINENSGYRYEKPNIATDYYYQQPQDYYSSSTSSSSSSSSSPPNSQQYNNNNKGINANNFQSGTTSGFSTSWPSTTGAHIGQTFGFSTKPHDAAGYQNHFGHGQTSSLTSSSSLSAAASDNNIDYLQMQSHSYELPSYFIMQQPPKQTQQQQHQQQQEQKGHHYNYNHNHKNHNYDGLQYNGNGHMDKYALGTQYQYHQQDNQQQQPSINAYTPPSLEFQPPYY